MPICVDKGSDAEGAKEVNQQLVTLVPMGGVNLKIYAGSNVTIKGNLFHAITGHHHTALLVQMTSIHKAKQ
jgi:hypothetical protein